VDFLVEKRTVPDVRRAARPAREIKHVTVIDVPAAAGTRRRLCALWRRVSAY